MKMSHLRARLFEKFPDSSLTPLAPLKVEALRSKHPNAPADYSDFLSEIGYGRIGQMRLSVYSGPIEPGEIYDPVTARELGGILLVADDFQGYCFGYDVASDWAFGEVDDQGRFSGMEETASFVEFLQFWCSLSSDS